MNIVNNVKNKTKQEMQIFFPIDVVETKSVRTDYFFHIDAFNAYFVIG